MENKENELKESKLIHVLNNNWLNWIRNKYLIEKTISSLNENRNQQRWKIERKVQELKLTYVINTDFFTAE